jgi:NAD(P)-dependent dehydrogenase (short-subunit alcohol dehydrogenase family)
MERTISTARVAVVTGATSGLGQAAALSLARAGHHVVLVGRDGDRGRQTLAEIERIGSGELALVDFFSMDDVRALGARLTSAHPAIALLVNNAGGTFSADERTKDGLERTFALNVAAPFALTEALMPSLVRGRARVVNLVTGVPSLAKATSAQLTGARAGPGIGSYVRAKLAMIAITIEQQARYGREGVTFVALHPGIITGTRFGPEMPGWIKKIGPVVAKLLRVGTTLDEAAARYVAIATGPIEPAGFYYEGKLRPPPPHAASPAFRHALWAELELVVRG